MDRRRCFGSNEYSDKSGICKFCEDKICCGLIVVNQRKTTICFNQKELLEKMKTLPKGSTIILDESDLDKVPEGKRGTIRERLDKFNKMLKEMKKNDTPKIMRIIQK